MGSRRPRAADLRARRAARLAVALLVASLLCATGAASRVEGPAPDPARRSANLAEQGEGASASSFDYLYVEANEGGSSGGHAAIRLDDRVFHFENRDGLLVLDREVTREFLHAYALLGNRTVHVSRVGLRAADRHRIADQLEQRYRAQKRQLDVLAALVEDRHLLEQWREAAGEDAARAATVPVPTLGYFVGFDAEGDAGEGRDAAVSPTVVSLRARIEATGGDGALAGLRARATRLLEQALTRDPGAWTIELPERSDQQPAFAHSYARRIADAAASIAALEVLERGSPLADSATIALAGPSGRLSTSEIDALVRRRGALEGELLDLVRSERRDWGRPFLVGLARLAAADESLREGRLLLVDPMPHDAPTLPARILETRRDVVAEIAHAAAERIEDLRDSIARAEGPDGAPAVRAPGERTWSQLEESLSRLHELERAVREHGDLRIGRGTLVPARPGTFVLEPAPRSSRARLDADLARIRVREAQYRTSLEALYRYQLITRNCVSELFHALNDAFGQAPASVEGALGGYVDGNAGLRFIPFVSAQAVDMHYRVVAHRSVPSHREQLLREMREKENPLWVTLRESNTLTARSYRRAVGDSFFLFFTDFPDRAFALRPLLGVFNLGAGLGESVWGLLRLPFDGGDTLQSGLEGALTSLPELAFWNIRKGSNDWVSPRPQPLDD